MKYKELVILGLSALLVIYTGIKLVISDFYFIDCVMITAVIALPISIAFHFLGVLVEKLSKFKNKYFLVFLLYIVGVIIILNMSDYNNVFEGLSGFALLSVLYPSFVCHLSIAIYCKLFMKKNTSKAFNTVDI